MNLDIRVQPKASRNSVEIASDGTARVRVTAPPDKGKANDAVVKLLAAKLGVSRSDVNIVRGHTSRSKEVRIEGMDREDAIRLIRGA